MFRSRKAVQKQQWTVRVDLQKSSVHPTMSLVTMDYKLQISKYTTGSMYCRTTRPRAHIAMVWRSGSLVAGWGPDFGLPSSSPRSDTPFSKSNVDTNHASPKKIHIMDHVRYCKSSLWRSKTVFPKCHENTRVSLVHDARLGVALLMFPGEIKQLTWRTMSVLSLAEPNIRPAPSFYQSPHLTLVAYIFQYARSSSMMRDPKSYDDETTFASLAFWNSIRIPLCAYKSI